MAKRCLKLKLFDVGLTEYWPFALGLGRDSAPSTIPLYSAIHMNTRTARELFSYHHHHRRRVVLIVLFSLWYILLCAHCPRGSFFMSRRIHMHICVIYHPIHYCLFNSNGDPPTRFVCIIMCVSVCDNMCVCLRVENQRKEKTERKARAAQNGAWASGAYAEMRW